MALVINDRVKVTSTTTGTGAMALGAAVTTRTPLSKLVKQEVFVDNCKDRFQKEQVNM